MPSNSRAKKVDIGEESGAGGMCVSPSQIGQQIVLSVLLGFVAIRLHLDGGGFSRIHHPLFCSSDFAAHRVLFLLLFVYRAIPFPDTKYSSPHSTASGSIAPVDLDFCLGAG